MFSPVGKILTGQVPLSGMKIPFSKYTTPTLMYSKKIVPGTTKAIAENLRKGGKFAMFKAMEPILRGVRLKDVPGTKGSAWYDKQPRKNTTIR